MQLVAATQVSRAASRGVAINTDFLCVAVIVASPALFPVQCKNPRQIELANAFCRYLGMEPFA